MPLLGSLTAAEDLTAAVTCPDATLSRHELLGRAAAVAAEIAGAPAVAVDATPTAATVVAITAGLLAGVPVVPVPPDAGKLERAHILGDSGAALMLTDDPARAADLPALAVMRTAAGRAVPAEPAADKPALVLYTSGTTGPPKGVVISRAAIAADLDALAEAWQWTAADVLVHGLPLYHVHGLVLGVLGALRTGSRLVHTGKPTPEGYAAAGGTLYFGVPTVWSRICAAPAAARELSKARLLVSGSAALPSSVFATLRELTGQPPVERYGMTETLITISARADGPRLPGHVGFPVAGVETRLAGEDGHLQVRGATLLDGFLRDGTITPPDLVGDGWFPTGDIATIDADGNHRIVGRASTDLIKTGGFRVGAGEVEDALLTHPAVREVAVIGEPDDDLGQVITAYVVGDPVGADDLTAYVAERLSVHKRPRRVRFVESLPRNALGKVQKNRLP
jgi:fatty acid CoA ligase FadD36